MTPAVMSHYAVGVIVLTASMLAATAVCVANVVLGAFLAISGRRLAGLPLLQVPDMAKRQDVRGWGCLVLA
jgi:hypothetical protein